MRVEEKLSREIMGTNKKQRDILGSCENSKSSQRQTSSSEATRPNPPLTAAMDWESNFLKSEV